MDTPNFNHLFDTCRRAGYEVLIEHHGGRAVITISHPGVGPLVTWGAASGCLEETAKYALVSAQVIPRTRE